MITWLAPGPGYWELDLSHFVGGATPIVQHIQTEAMPAGMRKVFAELGTPPTAAAFAWNRTTWAPSTRR